MREMFYTGKNCATPAWVADTGFSRRHRVESETQGSVAEKNEDGDMDENYLFFVHPPSKLSIFGP